METAQEVTAVSARGRREGVTARAVTLGLVLTPLNVLFIVRGLWLWAWVTWEGSLFINTIAVLATGALLNRWLQRHRPRWAFSTGELLTVYVMLSLSTGLTCSLYDVGGSTHINMTYPFWFATPQNRWQEVVWPYLPSWLTVQDREVLTGFYQGKTSPYALWILKAWATPALWWTCLFGAIMWVSLCLNSILRRRWADEEKLPFPMTALPMQLADDRYALFGSKLFWLGASVAAAIGTWNAIGAVVPNLPRIPTSWYFGTLVKNNPPWTFLRFHDIYWGPWYVGLAYLIPVDLAFSLLAFGMIWTGEYVVTGYLGWSTSPWSGFPYGEHQTAGSFIALGLVILWLDRRFLAQVLRRAAGLSSNLSDEREEALGYRAAVLGALGGLAVLWCLLQQGGLAGWVAAAFLAHYFLMMVVLCRVRAQLGPPTHQLYGVMPNVVLATLTGTSVLGPRAMGMFFLLRPVLGGQVNNPMPVQLEGLKMAEGGRMGRRRLAAAMAVVPVLALLAYFWATLHVGYHLGMTSGQTHINSLLIGSATTDGLRASLDSPSSSNLSASLAMLVAAVITLLLYFLKLQYAWWPLHPVAFPIAMSNTIAGMAPALFITWLAKLLLLRYGGLRAHRRALPLFLGLLVGEATALLLRELVSAVVGRSI